MQGNTTNTLKQIFAIAQQKAIEARDTKVRLAHLVLGALVFDNIFKNIVRTKITDHEILKVDIENLIRTQSTDEYGEGVRIEFSDEFRQLFEEIKNDVPQNQAVDIDDCILAIIEGESEVGTILISHGITFDWLDNEFKSDEYIHNGEVNADLDPAMSGDAENGGDPDLQSQNKQTKTPALDNFSRDLTKLAREGKLDPIVGREQESERLATILARRKKNNPALIGEPGVGKTAIVEKLAQNIVANSVPEILIDKRVLELDINGLVAGTKYRGQFEERMKVLLKELKDNPDIILFIDELHTIVGAGNSSGGMDTANVFKPALARGEIQCIGATTLNEYRESIEKDGALERRFQSIIVDEPTKEESLDILKAIRELYENHHGIQFAPGALEEAVRLADRYITNRNFPDKVIDVIDEAGASISIRKSLPDDLKNLKEQINQAVLEKNRLVKEQAYTEAAQARSTEQRLLEELKTLEANYKNNALQNRIMLGKETIALAVSRMTKIPVHKLSQNESERLLQTEEILSKYIIGQKNAVDKVSSAIRRNRIGIRIKKKPIGTFLFVGSTGIGKTELAKMLAQHIFGNEDSLIKIDMSEYQERHTISQLIGSPPGYVGYGEGGQLTEKVRRKPYSVVLFDEIEKAHPDIFNTLLQVFDEGVLTDRGGRKVNFQNTIIIMTSNLGVKELQDKHKKGSLGFSVGEKNVNDEEILTNSIKKVFKPEFINRIDDIVFFNLLSKDNIKEIIKLQLNQLKEHMRESLTFQLSYTQAVEDFILENGYKEEYGAREVSRVIQRNIEDAISEFLLIEKPEPNSEIKIRISEGKIKVELVQNEANQNDNNDGHDDTTVDVELEIIPVVE